MNSRFAFDFERNSNTNLVQSEQHSEQIPVSNDAVTKNGGIQLNVENKKRERKR